jgi:hypothetical protein
MANFHEIFMLLDARYPLLPSNTPAPSSAVTQKNSRCAARGARWRNYNRIKFFLKT